MKIRQSITSLLILISPVISMAANLIESKDQDGMTSRMYIDNNRARFEMPGNGGRIIIDLDKQNMHLVIDDQRIIINMSSALKSDRSNAIKQAGFTIKALGNGPTIAGYTTREYEEYVNDQYCGSVFNSTSAMNDLGIDKFARAFTAMAEELDSLFASMPGNPATNFIDKCDRADISLSYQMKDIGFPLKSTDQNRQQDTLVTRIDKKASLPANAFGLPKNYKITTAQNFVNDMMQQVPQGIQTMIQNIPPETMKQMMQNIPPEMMEMIQKQMQGQ
ncbi:MAG: hypothetical protein OEZ38_05340 [Gammaproteobacteria bacterium]|nr:hypothetical protein [Gammaproteobacteria bacterium]